eukprot:COSAG02_NODE_2059_length_9974_cov_6.226532_13_plen_544_part_00
MARSMMRTIIVLLRPLAVAAMIVGAAYAQAPPKLSLKKTFSANMTGYSFSAGTGNMTSNSQPVAISEELVQILNVEVNPDGRAVHVVFDYHNDSRAGIFSLQPFFDEHVCFIFPPQPVPPQYNAFEIGVEFLWFNQAWDPNVNAYYKASHFNRTSDVDGEPCDVWQWSVGPCSDTECDQIEWCVQRETGGLLHVSRTQKVPNPKNKTEIFNTELRNTFTGYRPTADATSFKTPATGCADMRPIKSSTATPEPEHPRKAHLLNDPVRLAAINEAADSWTAAASAVWEGMTADDASARLGLLTTATHTLHSTSQLRPLSALHGLPLPSASQLAARDAALAAHGGAIPASFDLRQRFPQCSSIVTVRNQGNCGGCWAFAGAESLADRLCIADTARFGNLSLSPEYFMDCDSQNAGCGGGLIDDAWIFLEQHGLVSESCDPFLYCAHPASPSCETGPHPKRPVPHKLPCPTKCADGTALAIHRTTSAYAVATPADVRAMQTEIMAHGSIEVGFQVFSDFMSYKNGTYKRTRGAQLKGGHVSHREHAS